MNKSNSVSKSVEIKDIAFPSFIPKSNISPKEIEELEESIRLNGIMQPIGICENDSEEYEEYKYLIIWGRRRMIAAANLGIEKIPAVVLAIKPSKEEFLKYSTMEAKTSVPMNRSEIFDAIKLIWIQFGDAMIASELTGIPLPLVKDALRSQRIERTKGAKDLYDYSIEICTLPETMAHKVIDVVLKPDNVSVDVKKGKKLADVLSTLEIPMRENVIKAALNTPQGDVDGWVADAKAMRNYRKRTFNDLSIELIEEEDYGLLKMAEANGLTVNQLINKIVKDKLFEEGFLKDK